MVALKRMLVLLPAVLALCGCRSTGERTAVPEVDQILRERVAASVVLGSAVEETRVPWNENGLLSRDAAVVFALQHNSRIAAELARVREANAELAQAGLLPNPRLGLSLGIEPGGGIETFTASINQTLSALWLRPAREAVADARLRGTVLNAANKSLELAAEVERSHQKALHLQESILLLEEEEALVQEMIRSAEARLETGLGHRTELDRLIAEHHAIRTDQAAASSDLEVLKRSLQETMGIPKADTKWYAVAKDREAEPLGVTEAEAIASGIESRIDIQAAYWSVLGAERDVVFTRRDALPEIDGGLAFERDFDERTIGPRVGVEIPLFDRGRARTDAAHARLDRERFVYETARAQATREIRQTWSGLQQASQALNFHRETILPHAESALARTEVAFDTGDADRMDIHSAQRDLLHARHDLLKARLRYDFGVIDYKHATGWADFSGKGQ